jgi:hypothetical protein
MTQIYVIASDFVNYADRCGKGLRFRDSPVNASALDTCGYAAVAELVDALP